MLSCCGDSLLTLSPIYCDVISSVTIRESMTSHGHMTHQEKEFFCGSGDEDLLTLSPIYCDVIARVRNVNPLQSNTMSLGLLEDDSRPIQF